MCRAHHVISVAILAVGLAHPQSNHHNKARPTLGSSPAVLWRQPDNIQTRDLFYGPGGPTHAPKPPLKFSRENHKGTQPKFFVRDSANVRWGVKRGKEARTETTATRLLWAVGYFADEEYYVRSLPLEGVPESALEVPKSGKVGPARMKRHIKHMHKVGFWRWDSNPFAGTRELNGLKVMMELMNNTDFKRDHLVVYDANGKEQRYMVKDLGATFGCAGGGYSTRTKGVLGDFQRYDLIRHQKGDSIDFWYFKQIPRADAKWVGELAGQLSDKQISDAFRAGGFTPEEVEGFTRKMRDKINELRRL